MKKKNMIGGYKIHSDNFLKHNVLCPHTFAGGTLPAAVICPVKKRPKLFAANTTALYLMQT